MKRKHGLLKKAAELSILCGLKVSLVFSDIQPNIFHVFSNDCPYKVDYEGFLKDNFIKEKSVFNEYSIFDYPFESMADQESKILVEPPRERLEGETLIGKTMNFETEKKERDTNLKKREPLRSGSKGASNIKASAQVPIVLTFDATNKMKTGLKMMETEPTLQMKPLMPELSSFKYTFVGFDGLSHDQKVEAQTFVGDLDLKLINHLDEAEIKGQPDEESICLLMARALLLKYLGFSQELSQKDHMTYLLRSLIDFDSILASINLLRELIPSNDQFFLKLKQFTNILINALVNPYGFEISCLTSLRGGKPILPLASFLIRSLLQQVRLLDSMTSGDKSAVSELGSFVNADNSQYVEQVIIAVLNIIASERSKTGLKSTPIKKPVFKIKSENSNQEQDQNSRENKPLNLFGASQEKYLERDRKLLLPSLLK